MILPNDFKLVLQQAGYCYAESHVEQNETSPENQNIDFWIRKNQVFGFAMLIYCVALLNSVKKLCVVCSARSSRV